jgi:thioredoxin reductase (NADPH)
MESQKTENVVIIGGGPSGLAAATYIARANLAPVVLAGSPPGGQLTLTTEVENFPGFESILGPELVEKMNQQAKKLGSRIIDSNVLKIEKSGDLFKLFVSKSTVTKIYPEVTDKDYILAKSVIIATGAKALWLGLESETRLRGRGVSACATCDGFFFRNKVVAVIGGGDTALEEASTLTKFASKVYLIHRRDSFRASKIMQDRALSNPKIEVVWNAGVQEIIGEQKVAGIKLLINEKEKKEIAVDGVFVAIGHKPDTDIFKGTIETDAKGYIQTSARVAYDAIKSGKSDASLLAKFNFDYQTMTSVDGLFAAGDCVDHLYRQATTAAGSGVAAALEAERWLEDKG